MFAGDLDQAPTCLLDISPTCLLDQAPTCLLDLDQAPTCLPLVAGEMPFSSDVFHILCVHFIFLSNILWILWHILLDLEQDLSKIVGSFSTC
jgi:hypothetical protein